MTLQIAKLTESENVKDDHISETLIEFIIDVPEFSPIWSTKKKGDIVSLGFNPNEDALFENGVETRHALGDAMMPYLVHGIWIVNGQDELDRLHIDYGRYLSYSKNKNHSEKTNAEFLNQAKHFKKQIDLHYLRIS